MIRISVENLAVESSRFTLIVMCGGMDSEGNKLYVDASQRQEDEPTTTLECADAHTIELIVYFIPKSLPKGKNTPIADHPPFPATLTVESDDQVIYSQKHQINGWGGAAIKLELRVKS